MEGGDEQVRMRLLIVALTLTVGASFGLVRTPDALAFGQCGGTVHTGAQLYNAWVAEGVTSQAAVVMQPAGFHRMDNSLSVWMRQRVVRAPLARAASPVDYGCHPGQLFSVGPRLIPSGTPVMAVLPAKFSKAEVRLAPHKGFHRITVRTKAAGKSNCSNPLKGSVTVFIYVKSPQKHHKPKPKPKPHFTTVSCTGPEEISGGGSVIVKCDVTDDNGAQISLNAQSQDANSQVSGINCFSQGGSPSCSGNGQFEFRVTGVNNTSNILTTTVVVYATANGVKSDPVTMTFDVDPSGGGF